MKSFGLRLAAGILGMVSILAGLASLSALRADDSLVREFSGSGSTTTGFFTVKDRWEIRWNALRVISVAVMSSDGSIVAGQAGVLRGSLFLPLGGKYYFKIIDGTKPGDVASPGSAPGDSSAPGGVSWHFQVVQLGGTEATGQDLTVFTPFFVPPDSAVTPAVAPSAPPPAPVLTAQQIAAMVSIVGDNAHGNGFLLKTAQGTFAATSIHLLANNPNLKILTFSGDTIPVTGFKGATDRDLALISVPAGKYDFLPISNDVASAQVGDKVLVPVVEGHDVSLRSPVTVGEIDPGKISFTGRLFSANLNAPAIREDNGQVLAMLTAQPRSDLSSTIASAWPANGSDDFERTVYFGMRIDDVPGWETYDMAQFLNETAFLDQFHRDTRYLDSYLNGSHYYHHHHGDGSMDDFELPDDRYYRKSPRILKAQARYKEFANGADLHQQLDATRELLFDLQGMVDDDVTRVQQMDSPYTFDRNRAREELAYRDALKKELSGFDSNISALDQIARRR